jgi:hypothetical protein
MGTTTTNRIDARRVDRATAASIEAAEARAWADLYDAAPKAWADEAGVGRREIGGVLALHWAASSRRYFSRTIGLGVARPASEAQLDEILALWQQLGIEMFLVQSLPHCRPEAYHEWLAERGLHAFDAQDRIVRGGEVSILHPMLADREITVERVTAKTAEEWADFLQRVYRLETGPWLRRLIGRRGWHQYLAREGGETVAARGMHIGPDGIAWLGMDGPVPGLTTRDYEPDAALCSHMVADGLRLGAQGFITDIEARSDDMDTPAYEYFARLGFRRPYVRAHYTRSG